MELSSPRFKALTVTFGFSFWFFIITNTIHVFSIEIFIAIVLSMIILTQLFAKKVSKGLDVFAIVNTKIFLGALFVFVVFFYGLFFKLLQIDLLRLEKKSDTYWLKMEELKRDRIFKQY